MQAYILLALLAVASTATQAQYVRPINADCVASPSGDASLFPKEYMLAGDVTQQPFYTQVCTPLKTYNRYRTFDFCHACNLELTNGLGLGLIRS